MKGENHFDENSPAQAQDYESWVNSLGNIQDGIFQNTPMTQHTIDHQQSFIPQVPNHPINFIGSTPLIQHQINQNQMPGNTSDGNLDFFFNSPDRFYRDIINESPTVTKTPHGANNSIGRTPLKNLNMSFSTPLFLRNIETSNTTNSATKNFTPLKHQLFPNANNSLGNTSQNLEIFKTPNDKTQNSLLNSSPTTIQMNSSAVKDESSQSLQNDSKNENGNKILPMSPTPVSKIQQLSPMVSSMNDDSASLVPKMGYFKKSSPKSKSAKLHKQPSVSTHSLVNKKAGNGNNNNTKFQIIMTDVNSFASSQGKSRRRRKLTRSTTQVGAGTTTTDHITAKVGNVNKKQTLKRSISQPSAVMSNLPVGGQGELRRESSSKIFLQSSIPMPLQDQTAHQRNRMNTPPLHQLKQYSQISNTSNQTITGVEDFFGEVGHDQKTMGRKW